MLTHFLLNIKHNSIVIDQMCWQFLCHIGEALQDKMCIGGQL